METEPLIEGKPAQGTKLALPISIVIAALLISSTWLYISRGRTQAGAAEAKERQTAAVSLDEITPTKGATLPVKWGDLGAKMIETGVIDKEKFEGLYSQRGGLSEADKKLLYTTDNGNLVITPENSGLVLNLLWAFGLGNKNAILDTGPMKDGRYGGAEKFASTGGWTLATGDAMKHYSRHSFVALSKEQQALVEEVSKNIFRPCCDNPTYFPDCNHGMAMLGLLELMASQGVSETDMYKVALEVNAYWFPNNYQTVATFLKSKGIAWNSVNPKDILAASFSSASAYKQILAETEPIDQKGGSSCGA